jgi:hypothetical protein
VFTGWIVSVEMKVEKGVIFIFAGKASKNGLVPLIQEVHLDNFHPAIRSRNGSFYF